MRHVQYGAALIVSVLWIIALSSGVAHAQPPGEAPQKEETTPQDETNQKPAPTGASEDGPGSEPTVDDEVERKREYRRLARLGQEAFAANDLEQAFAYLSAAYEKVPNPSVLFNLGLIAEKQGDLEQAVSLYKDFSEASGVSLQNRKRASARIEVLQEILRSGAAEEDAPETDAHVLPALEALGMELEAESPEEPAERPGPDATADASEDSPAADAAADDSAEIGADESAEIGSDPRPRVRYGWPVYASFGTATLTMIGGVAARILAKARRDDEAAALAAGDTGEAARFADQADTWNVTSVSLLVATGVLVGVGATFVILDSADVAPASASKAGEAGHWTVGAGASASGGLQADLRFRLRF